MTRSSSIDLPHCFGKPDRCPECAGCGVRARCYKRQMKTHAVFLLPVPRPVQHKAVFGSSFTRKFTEKEPAS